MEVRGGSLLLGLSGRGKAEGRSLGPIVHRPGVTALRPFGAVDDFGNPKTGERSTLMVVLVVRKIFCDSQMRKSWTEQRMVKRKGDA